MAGLLLLSACLCVTAKAEADPACRSPWLPLDAGNYWVYRTDTRFITGGYYTMRVLGPYELGGQVWCQVEKAGQNLFLRTDEKGRILQRTIASPQETVLLDLSGLTSTAIESPLGFASEALAYTVTAGLGSTTWVYALGFGMLRTSLRQNTGSSGGLLNSDELVELSVGGRVFRLPAASGPSVTLDLADTLKNCAIPCYYAACGIGSPVDAPSAVKPCLEARLAGTGVAPNSVLQVTTASSDGKVVYERRIPVGSPAIVAYDSLPFYDQVSTGRPITLYPSGEYFVTLYLIDPKGKLGAATSKRVTIP